MNKSFLILKLVIIFAVGFTGFVFSQDAIPSGTARYEALGYNPFIMDAAIDLDRNPAWGNKYNNYAFGDLGRYSSGYDYKGGYSNEDKDYAYRLRDQYLAVNFRTGKQWSLGVLLNKEQGRLFNSDMRAYYESIGNEKPQVPFKLLVAFNSSTNVTLGLAPYVAYWKRDITSTNYSENRSTNTWGATFGIKANSSTSSWSEGTVGVLFNTYSAETTTPDTSFTLENDGGLQLTANYRGWYKVKNTNVSVVPYINFDIMNWTPTGIGITEKNDYWNLLAGVGINFPINNEGMLAGGLSGGYMSNSFTDTTGTKAFYKIKFEDIIFPKFNIGVEWNLTDWMQGRFGYSRNLANRKVEYTPYDTSVVAFEIKESFASNPDETITVGLGMQFGSFSLDGLIGERYIQIGPNLLSGKENDLYGVVSMSYNFKK